MFVTLNNKIAGALSSQHNPLNLRGFFLNQEDIHSLAAHLNRETRITALSLYDCNIGGNGAQLIAEAICDNAIIHTLDLTGNDLGDVGTVSLARALEVNVSISHLYLGRNSIGDKGINRLAEALQKNQAVSVINLERNGLSEEHLEIILKALNDRKTPAEFFVAGNEIASPVGAGILERSRPASNIRVHGIGPGGYVQKEWVEKVKKGSGSASHVNTRLS